MTQTHMQHQYSRTELKRIPCDFRDADPRSVEPQRRPPPPRLNRKTERRGGVVGIFSRQGHFQQKSSGQNVKGRCFGIVCENHVKQDQCLRKLTSHVSGQPCSLYDSVYYNQLFQSLHSSDQLSPHTQKKREKICMLASYCNVPKIEQILGKTAAAVCDVIDSEVSIINSTSSFSRSIH